MLNTTVELNDFTAARVIEDSTAEDPRITNLEGDAAEGVFVLDIGGDLANAKVIEPGWFKTFQEISHRHSARKAVRAMNILRGLGADIPAFIDLRLYQGHAQSDWADLVISGPTAEVAQVAYETFTAWARGDAYGILIERKCPVTGDWFSSEDDLPLFGVYCTKDLEFYEEVRAVAAEHFDLEARPISEAGRLDQERDTAKDSIRELLGYFKTLEDQNGGSSELSNTAREIIIAQAKLISSLEDELAELR